MNYGTMTLYLRNALLNMLLRGDNFIIPLGSFVQLWDGSPINEDSSSVGTPQDAIWTISNVGKTGIANTIVFENESGDPWSVSHIAVLDDENILFYAPIRGGRRNVLDGTSFTLEPGTLTVTLD